MRQTIQATLLDGTTDANGNAVQEQTYVELYQGDDLILDFDVKNPAGATLDLTGKQIVTSIRPSGPDGPGTGDPIVQQTVDPNAPPNVLPQATQEFGRSVTWQDPALFTWDTKLIDPETSKEYTIVPPSPLRVRRATTNTADPVTPPEGAVALVGVPSPVPAYNADLVLRAGVLKWRQHERAKATFTGAGDVVAVVWPDFQTRAFEAKAANGVVATPAGVVGVELEGVTSTGATVRVTDPTWSGEVDIDITEVV